MSDASKWSKCPKSNRCWVNEHGEHYEFPPCVNHPDRPAEHDAPENLCEWCWLAWFTEGWPN